MSLNYGGSYLSRLSSKSPDLIIAQAVRETISLAETEFSPMTFEGPWTTGGLGISVLGPRNVGATNQASSLQGGVAGSGAWGVTAVTASTWTNWINLSIDNRIFIIVTGVFNRSSTPNITALKIFANGQDLPVITLEEMYTFEEQKAYFTQPVIIQPGNVLQIQVFSPITLAGIPAEQIGLTGYIVGKRAYLIATA
ncbi:MAG: hypothetical protein Q7R49_00570 [Candidatus Daviesbacteria bacterium]|nr:hypothetical protein [Candidatus Daviesbacteria bacterium]